MTEAVLVESELTNEEKKKTLEDLFPQNKVYVDNVGDYLAENFKKIDGFDYRWSSLITSNPLLFEDVDYVRVKSSIRNECTPEEVEAYRSGKLRELYSTFETMLICNLKYYDRIMNYCTMVFCKYVRLSESECVSNYLQNIPYMIDMTPTQVWCAALTSVSSTEWELNYAWKMSNKKIIKKYPEKNSNKSLLELNFKNLYNNKTFAKFVEYCSYRVGVNGFFQTLLVDITSNKKLSQVCSKFTRTSVAIDKEQLGNMMNYLFEDARVTEKLYKALDKCLEKTFIDKNNYGIYIYAQDFFIFTNKFKINVLKDDNGEISKKYMSNSYECFVAEKYLSESAKYQIDWAKYQLPYEFDYDKQMLSTILLQMLNEDYKNVKCIRKTNDDIYSEITFTGTFANLYIHEKFYFHNQIIHEQQRCYGKPNAANYVVNRGYYIFGAKHDVDILFVRDFTKEQLVNHYSNYCIPVIQHMSDIIAEHTKQNNDVIEVLTTGKINPLRLNNKNIKYSTMTTNEINSREVMKTMKSLSKNIADTKVTQGLGYYKAIK